MANHVEYDLQVDVQVRKVIVDDEQPTHRQWTNESLTVAEKCELGALDFLEVSHILGQFHKVAEEIKKERNVG